MCSSKREWNCNRAFLVRFAITGTIVIEFSISLTEENAKNSPFVRGTTKNEDCSTSCLVNDDGLHGGNRFFVLAFISSIINLSEMIVY
ncbi:hypothetical protein CDL12_08205 [Handroanthus impetiginosus]|uniref:Uncharacterized protein n=1 Tax=Handroanthus impetiginosus TaxID=429701 RepID=A0A2G9HNK5_9LAMI|nr:hypothetical protein CDL12_08205 [Handroanthus impetiginosus]